jgi:hypothetical protein
MAGGSIFTERASNWRECSPRRNSRVAQNEPTSQNNNCKRSAINATLLFCG